MKEIKIANFRCFRERQTARLAPLTLLVGENSTGKTSLLALIRVLWDVGVLERFPDFKEPPFDLGSFDEIAHHRGGRGGRATEFEAGFSLETARKTARRHTARAEVSRFDVIFRQDGAAPFPSIRRIERERTGVWADVGISADGRDGGISIQFATRNGRWRIHGRGGVEWGLSPAAGDIRQRRLPPVQYLIRRFLRESDEHLDRFQRLGATSGPPTREDMMEVSQLGIPTTRRFSRPFAGAPMRSRPHRTYDPSHIIQDAEGDYIPMFLSSVARRNQKAWESLKSSLERFGRAAGLFDEIGIRTLGKTGGPFRIQVRKFGKPAKGPNRNIIDMGYGVSQVLPVVTELLRPRGHRMFLLQQPEVHLHPSAQAALGNLFCERAAAGRQLIIETHSDHLIDRVRMDVRDRKSDLKPEDVSILYFERRNLAVTIHSLGWDANGNLVGGRGRPVPDSYRQFFRTERRRSLGL